MRKKKFKLAAAATPVIRPNYQEMTKVLCEPIDNKKRDESELDEEVLNLLRATKR